MEMKAKLIDMLERVSEVEQELISTLTASERSAIGEPENWSIKDQIAHCAAWNERLGKNISTALQGITPSRDEDYEQVNSEIFQENREKPWEAIQAYSERTSRELVEVVRSSPENNFTEGELLPWQSGRELWKVIIGTGFTHPLTHYSQAYLERGKADLALELQEEMAQSLSTLDNSPSWLGVIRYNLACFYSLSGQKEKAISGLRESLQLNSELTDWSKQDPDFDPIREEPEYLSLYDE